MSNPKPYPKCNSNYVIVEYTPHYLWYVACTKCGCMTNLYKDMLEAEKE